MEVFGIDISKYNGNINFAKVKNAGKSFVIIKGTQKDNKVEPSFEGNYVGAIAAGLDVGVYRYVYAKDVNSAQAEANALAKILKGKNIKCGVWLDMEDDSIKRLGKSVLTAIINTEAAILSAAGFGVGVYCNRDWYYNVLDRNILKSKYPFWIARYPSSDTGIYNSKSSLNPKEYAAIWQYSSKGKVNGISGSVDLNVAFQDPKTIFKGDSTIYYPKYTGTTDSIVKALEAVGEKDTSLANRKKIGIANGIAGVGTAEGNTQMLNLLKSGKLKKI